MNKFAATSYLAVLVVGCSVFMAEARPIYSQREDKPCSYCHLQASGGGPRGFRGQFYGANGLSFDLFSEKREASIAGVTPDAMDRATSPAVAYAGNVTGPATQQIQLASLRGPVILLFLDKVNDDSKAAVKAMGDLAKAYGNKVAVFGIAKTDAPTAIKLSTDLGARLRIFPDNGDALKKFSATPGLDIAVVAKLGDPVKTLPGFSKANVETAIKLIADEQGVVAPTFDTSKLPTSATRGGR